MPTAEMKSMLVARKPPTGTIWDEIEDAPVDPECTKVALMNGADETNSVADSMDEYW
jgi:hypothetical protein